MSKLKMVLVFVAAFFVACAGCDKKAESPTKDSPSAKPAKGPGGPPGGGGCETCSDVTPQHPVILVHGRNDTKARWDTLVSSWSSRGYTEGTNLFRIDMTADCGANDYCSTLAGHPASTVNESYAKCLQAFVDDKVPEGQVDLVTHSQGGVTARYYARFLDSAKVNDMVNMSGPLQGTNNCALAGACTGINPETCPDSPIMRHLNGVAPEGDGSNDETPAGPSYAVVVSDKDSVIQPWCSAEYIESPQTMQADDMDCRRTNYTLDATAVRCAVSSQHLVIPTDQAAIDFAYCRVNDD